VASRWTERSAGCSVPGRLSQVLPGVKTQPETKSAVAIADFPAGSNKEPGDSV
jgi:hypothetical protein